MLGQLVAADSSLMRPCIDASAIHVPQREARVRDTKTDGIRKLRGDAEFINLRILTLRPLSTLHGDGQPESVGHDLH